eukprot:g16724.t1
MGSFLAATSSSKYGFGTAEILRMDRNAESNSQNWKGWCSIAVRRGCVRSRLMRSNRFLSGLLSMLPLKF